MQWTLECLINRYVFWTKAGLASVQGPECSDVLRQHPPAFPLLFVLSSELHRQGPLPAPPLDEPQPWASQRQQSRETVSGSFWLARPGQWLPNCISAVESAGNWDDGLRPCISSVAQAAAGCATSTVLRAVANKAAASFGGASDNQRIFALHLKLEVLRCRTGTLQ